MYGIGFPNMTVELAARVGELGRSRSNVPQILGNDNQDRIISGTDAVPNGTDTPQQILATRVYEIYFPILGNGRRITSITRPGTIPPRDAGRFMALACPMGS